MFFLGWGALEVVAVGSGAGGGKRACCHVRSAVDEGAEAETGWGWENWDESFFLLLFLLGVGVAEGEASICCCQVRAGAGLERELGVAVAVARVRGWGRLLSLLVSRVFFLLRWEVEAEAEVAAAAGVPDEGMSQRSSLA